MRTAYYNVDTHKTVPLDAVVLDLSAANPLGNPEIVVENVLAALRRGTTGCKDVADQIEAQTKPPRIPEPGPTGSLVNAEGCLWAKAEDGNWVCLGDGNSGLTKPWQFLISPEAVTS